MFNPSLSVLEDGRQELYRSFKKTLIKIK